ncbi:MAG TPA: hypothetical protein VJ417_16990 [Candidatus Glassbacteria bacterium]|nr:hypothetical protein [Candidatus Glassbacteria bacterium]
MDQIKSAVDDLIEETRMRELDDGQIEWRIRKFTEICESEIEAGVPNMRTRSMLLERLQIMKCLYDHSSVKKPYAGGVSAREFDESQRNRRLVNIVRRRRLALEMIEKADPLVARKIAGELEKIFATSLPAGRPARRHPAEPAVPDKAPLLSPHHWYFLYFNLFLMALLVTAILFVVR